MVTRECELWRPPPHQRPTKGAGRWITIARRLLDLQFASIEADVAAEVPSVQGNVLDVGCGAQPFRHLFAGEARYHGIDSNHAQSRFGYVTPDTTYYEGDSWPVSDESIDFILCTETLEHISDPAQFLGEAARCLVRNGGLLLTVPFAARWHFIPYDYWRFTPSSLMELLTNAGFRDIEIFARGNAATVACYKLIVLVMPLLMPQGKSRLSAFLSRLCAMPLLPFLFLLAGVGQLTLLGRGGDDCLGYTVVAKKR
jgi:SAM-dependent methyltransferase